MVCFVGLEARQIPRIFAPFCCWVKI